ncbi:hypothetical protein Y032_0045g1106 [Ancylostoma ceylanicum]|uniref:Uncharacterized protein n=1 Tax=Ancylostoma ceylanicum TaxID=53326 RepID=A0A016UDX2_9BILA|nr:hypothetical protein Y032_0045g1106 [Ancylostoma ceylanicum]
MEYIDNVEIRQIFDNVSPKEMLDVLRVLAYNQASSLQFSSEEKRKLAGNPMATVYPAMVKPDMRAFDVRTTHASGINYTSDHSRLPLARS